MTEPYIPLKRRTFAKPTEDEARAVTFVADEMIAHIQYERMRWLINPPIGNMPFLVRCLSKQRLLRR